MESKQVIEELKIWIKKAINYYNSSYNSEEVHYRKSAYKNILRKIEELENV